MFRWLSCRVIVDAAGGGAGKIADLELVIGRLIYGDGVAEYVACTRE
jgi:hypothetical protein